MALINQQMEGGAKVIETHTVSIDPASISAVTTAETTATITGVTTSDYIISANPTTALTAGLVYGGARVSATNTVAINLGNITASPVNGGAITWTVTVLKNGVTD